MNFFKYINFLTLNFVLTVAEVDEEQKEEKIDFAVGGQALIEGVMMRSPEHLTMAVRKPDGSITIKKDKFLALTQKYNFLNIPIIRGFINLIEMMYVGSKAINFSANESLDVPNEKGESTKLGKIGEFIMMVVSFVLAMAFSATLFQALPLKATLLLENSFPALTDYYVLFNIVDALIKVTIFLTYIYILTQVPSFRRLFQYHGAEHKSIFTYEQGEELKPENAKHQTRFHPRCGTSFILIVFVIGIFVYSVIPRPENFWSFLSLRLVVLPIISGLSYEVLKYSAKHTSHWLVRASIMPGLMFQRLTTKEPDEAQLEVGLISIKKAIE